MTRRERSPSAGNIKSPSQGPHFTRSIRIFSATGLRLLASTHARIMSRLAFGGGGFLDIPSRIAASCCLDIVTLCHSLAKRTDAAGRTLYNTLGFPRQPPRAVGRGRYQAR